jgi:acyl-CoA reductase-like NAD-dependent aldehyde dehydrogenase
VHLLTFTGSAAVGWELKQKAGRKKVVLELGGNAAAIVCQDADLEHAARRIAAGANGYAGQSCISVQRVLVHRSRLADLRALVLLETARLVVGDPADPLTICGPVIDVGAAERLQAWCEEAEALGGRKLAGGARDGTLLQPCVFEDVPAHARMIAQEAFGPVVCLDGFDDLAEALHRVNDTPYGLQAGVFTDSLQTLWTCLENLEVGAVIHDDVPTFRVDHMPYGGVKASGLGREGLHESVLEYTEPRMLAMRPGPR